MPLRKRKDTVILKKKHCITLSGELALEEFMSLRKEYYSIVTQT